MMLSLSFFSHFHAEAKASFKLNSDFHPKTLFALVVSAKAETISPSGGL